MVKFGKWIGGGLGWAFGGPIGAIFGFVVGSVIDSIQVSTGVMRPQTMQGDFIASLLVLAASVMKADGKVVKSELDYVRSFFLHQFGEGETQQYMVMLRDILKQDIPVADVCHQIRDYMEYPARLQLLHFLFGISSADGHVHPNEVDVITNIANQLGIRNPDFVSIRAMFVKDVNNAYKILEVSADASDEELKKAYRRMAVKYHPDKVNNLGPEVQKAAQEKFQHLNAAYEEIKKQRGIT